MRVQGLLLLVSRLQNKLAVQERSGLQAYYAKVLL